MKQTVKIRSYRFRRMQLVEDGDGGSQDQTDGGSQDPENLGWNSDFSPKMMKMFYSLVIRQAQWNTTLQKHTNIILKFTILLSSQICL